MVLCCRSIFVLPSRPSLTDGWLGMRLGLYTQIGYSMGLLPWSRLLYGPIALVKITLWDYCPGQDYSMGLLSGQDYSMGLLLWSRLLYGPIALVKITLWAYCSGLDYSMGLLPGQDYSMGLLLWSRLLYGPIALVKITLWAYCSGLDYAMGLLPGQDYSMGLLLWSRLLYGPIALVKIILWAYCPGIVQVNIIVWYDGRDVVLQVVYQSTCLHHYLLSLHRSLQPNRHCVSPTASHDHHPPTPGSICGRLVYTLQL